MRTSISNLNGEQQNILHHLSKCLKRTIRPLMIICYGHRSSVCFQSSAFFNAGMEKKNSSVFDLFILIRDDEILPDSALQEIARRSSPDGRADNLIFFRMKDVLINLEHQNRFFSSIFRSGILLYGDKSSLKLLPHPLPPVCFTNDREKELLYKLLQHAQKCAAEVEHHLKHGSDNPQLSLILLNEAAACAVRYFMVAYWGIDIHGDLKQLLSFSENINPALKNVFPNNTAEEVLLFHLINLSFIDQGFCPGAFTIQTLFKRVLKMIAIGQHAAQKKIAQLLTT